MNRIIFTLKGKCQHEVRLEKLSPEKYLTLLPRAIVFLPAS